LTIGGHEILGKTPSFKGLGAVKLRECSTALQKKARFVKNSLHGPQHPRELETFNPRELEAFKRRSWWPEVSSLPDITTNWLAQPRIFNRLPLISSLSKDNFCLL
jgi:hypothetical protein